jgi:hypothetical protein
MEMILVKSLLIGDPDVISPVDSEYPDLHVPDVLAAYLYLRDKLCNAKRQVKNRSIKILKI